MCTYVRVVHVCALSLQLSFRKLVEVFAEEFSINPKSIIKIRKLPNTKLRRDVEVYRLEDYQELEAEILDV